MLFALAAFGGISILTAVALIRANLPPGDVGAGPMADTVAPPRPISAPSSARPSSEVEGATHQALNAVRAGNAAYAKGDLAGALTDYEAAVAALPDNADARNNLAQVLVRQSRVSEALPHLTEAVRLDPKRWAYRFNLARVYGQLDRWQDAVTEYRAASQLFPDDYATQFNLGLALLQVRDYHDAARSLEQAVASAPNHHSLLITLGTAYVGAERPDRARAAFEQFLDRAPHDPEALRVKALLTAMTAAGQ